MKNPTAGQDKMHHGTGIAAHSMGEDRSFGKVGSDNAHDIMRGGGSDPRRPMAKEIIDRTVHLHDQSGYNHAYTPDSDAFARQAERKAMGMGTPEPDGLYRR